MWDSLFYCCLILLTFCFSTVIYSSFLSICQLYDGFIKSLEAKLSQLRAALLVALVGYSFTDPQRAIDFFNTVLENRARLGVEACLCIEADIAVMQVRLGLTDEARVQLDKVEEQMESSGTGEAVVFSKVYRAMAEYRKVRTINRHWAGESRIVWLCACVCACEIERE